MATPKTVWGIDIGQCALKALKLRDVEGELQVEAFDIIEHPKILSQPDADRKQLIRNALEQFLARNSVSDSQVVVSVPGQSSFTRFVKLPPVEPKKIPDIVRFEAEQQIPFPINDVIWRWQTFQDADSPDVEVGIFAVKNVDIADSLSHFNEMELNVDVVQMAPLALYNFMTFDEQLAEGGATLLADVGADKTDLVVADGGRLWTRTIQIGGNNFTEALVRAFKLSFSKAEKLKRTAATSKYARQIFQAMRPVFADLVQEIQRSVGYYTSLHRETRFKRLVGLGNGFRLPGLQKFLEQNLNINVVRIDNYNKLSPSPMVNAPTFTENVLSFAVAYGLAVQGLSLTKVVTNLLPGDVARKRLWSAKRVWFGAAAAALLMVFASALYSVEVDRGKLALSSPDFVSTKEIAAELSGRVDQFNRLRNQGTAELGQIKATYDLLAYRDWWPSAMSVISNSINDVCIDQKYVGLYGQAPDRTSREKALAELKAKPRKDRRMVVIESLTSEYIPDVTNARLIAGPAAPGPAGVPGAPPAPVAPGTLSPAPGQKAIPGFKIVLTGWTPLPKARVNGDLAMPILTRGIDLAQLTKVMYVTQYGPLTDYMTREAVGTTVGGAAGVSREAGPEVGPRELGGGANTPTTNPVKAPDPLFPDEDMSQDTRFVIGWIFAVQGDGVTMPDDTTNAAK